MHLKEEDIVIILEHILVTNTSNHFRESSQFYFSTLDKPRPQHKPSTQAQSWEKFQETLFQANFQQINEHFRDFKKDSASW